ncbi:hypothetical protein V6Z94_000836 [Aspergillus fumigatus]
MVICTSAVAGMRESLKPVDLPDAYPLNEENINVLSSSKSPIPPWANSTTPCRAAHLQGKANNFIMSIKSSIELHPSSPSLPWQLSTPIHDVVLDLCLRHSCTVQNTSRPLLS